MRAVRANAYGAPTVLKVENNVPIPEPGADEVLINVKAAGINPLDPFILSGHFTELVRPPYTPGFDAAGIVEKVGANVNRFKKGDRVFIYASASGSFAEYATASVNHTFELPPNVSFEQGAGLGIPYLTAYHTLFQLNKLEPHHTVLVHGASGAVGLAAVQLARRHGVKNVVGTASGEEAIKLLSDPKLCGPGNVFNHRSPTYIDEMKAKFPKGFDVIVEMVANVNLKHDILLAVPRGNIMIVGSRGVADSVDTGRFMLTGIAVRGVNLFMASADEILEAGKAAVESARDGTGLPVVSFKFPLEDASKAVMQLLADSRTPGKVVLIL